MAQNKVPDGGYGWIIVCGSFLLNFIVVGMPRGFGVMYIILKERFNSTATQVAWVHALYNTSRMLLAPVASYLCDRYTTRRVVLAGSLLIFIGVTSSAFISSIYVMYFTYGIVAGVGGSMLFAPSLIVVGDYFSSKKGTAMGISTIGAGVGTLSFANMFTFLVDFYGYLGGILVVGAVVSHCAIAGALFRPLEQHLAYLQWKRPGKDVAETDHKLHKLPSSDEDISLVKKTSERGMEYIKETACVGSDNAKLTEMDHKASKVASISPPSNDILSVNNCDSDEIRSKGNSEHSEVVDPGVCNLVSVPSTDDNLAPGSSSVYNNETHSIASTYQMEKKEPQPSDDLPWIRKQLMLLTNKSFLAYVHAIACMPCCIMVVFLFIAAHAKQHGVSEKQRALVISIQGICDIIGRMSFGFVFDLKPIRHRRRYLHAVLGIFLGAVTMAIAPATSFWSLTLVFTIHGIVEGAYHAQRATILSEIVPHQQLSMCVGYMTFCQGVGNLTFPLVGGLLRDWLGTFDAFFLLGGGVFALVSLLNLMTYYFTRGQNRPKYQCSTH